jgi:hypothetical protein
VKKLLNYYRNEQGNVVLFVIGMLGIIMVLFILVVNLSSALATKQQSDTTVSQASLAATSAFYEEVKRVFYSYPNPIPVVPDEPDESEELENSNYEKELEKYLKKKMVYDYFKHFNIKLQEKKDSLNGLDLIKGRDYDDWTENEKELEAWDMLIDEELSGGDDPIKIAFECLLGIYDPYNYLGEELGCGDFGINSDIDVHKAAINMAILTIEKNGGILEEATLDITNDDRIEIRAATEVTSSAYDGFVESVTENLYQESSGPKIDFIDLIWTKTLPVYLEYE